MNASQRANENFIVSNPTTIPDFPATNAGILLSTGANNIFNAPLHNGQLGFVADSPFGTAAMHSYLDATPTVTESPVIAIYQGNENTRNVSTASATYPLSVRPFERTAAIDGRNRITVTRQNYRIPTHSTWVLGQPNAATTGKINVLDLTEYQLRIAFRGRRVDEFYSEQAAASLVSSITTPDFTTLNTGVNSARAWIIHNLAYNINRNSQAFAQTSRFPSNVPVVAFVVSSTATAGVQIGGASPITGGTAVTVVDVATGTDKVLTLTESMATSIKNAFLAKSGLPLLSVTWRIIPANLADTTTGSADMLVLMALDETLAFNDRIPQVKVRLDVGLTRGFEFETVSNLEWEQADEGQGLGRVLDLQYQATQGQRKYTLRHTLDPVINYPSPVNKNEVYNTFTIMHEYYHQNSFWGGDTIYRREIVLVPNSSVANIIAVSTNLETYLNSFLASGNNGTVKVF